MNIPPIAVILLAAALGCSGGSARADLPSHEPLLKILSPTSLVREGGMSLNPQTLASKKYLFLYFSGEACPPCKVFTPRLIEFYNKYARGGDFEILFISEDPSSEVMERYMKSAKMPWGAIKYGDPAIAIIKERLQQMGYPQLYLLDEKDQVIAKPELDGTDHVSWHAVNVWLKEHGKAPMHLSLEEVLRGAAALKH
ncbi:MAG: thioredoxin-like domain-containing protein [Verrucomicrobiota bacterium]